MRSIGCPTERPSISIRSSTGWITGYGSYYPSGPGSFTSYPREFLLHLPLDGDYNLNGIVDAADYVVWRKGLGTTYTQSDYNTWRSHFGQTAGSGASASAAATVPEPATFVLLMFAVASCRLLRSRAL
jgi:hypothetical protein